MQGNVLTGKRKVFIRSLGNKTQRKEERPFILISEKNPIRLIIHAGFAEPNDDVDDDHFWAEKHKFPIIGINRYSLILTAVPSLCM